MFQTQQINSHAKKLKLSFNSLFKATLLICLIVFFSKLFTLTTLHSAQNSSASESQNENEKEQTVQLDSTGLTLKLDFLNLTPQDTRILESLFNYREKLKKKTANFERKQEKLKIVESRIQQQIKELKRLKSELAGLLNQYTQQEERRISLLVKIYENMKAPQAAEIFNDLPEEQVLLLLNRMKEAKTALILANMDPKTASELTNSILTKKRLNK